MSKSIASPQRVRYAQHMPTLTDVRTWLERDLRGRVTIRPTDDAASITFATDRYHFTLTVNELDDYLGCTCRMRGNAPGENHFRFADLPDGKLNQETWQAIVAEIKRMEVRPFQGRTL